jgi:CRP-like cAMP-binding protein
MNAQKRNTLLSDFIRRDVNLTHEEIVLIADHCKEVNFPKNHTILRPGQESKYVYFIISGSARSFYVEYTGKTITWMFHFNSSEANVKNIFLVDYKSFLNRMPGTLAIETLSEVKVLQLSRDHVEKLLNSLPSYEKWTRILKEKIFVVIYDRIFTLLTMSATQRYLKLIKEESHLQEMFSNYYIASYLGVTPQSLSRIRKNISNQSSVQTSNS